MSVQPKAEKPLARLYRGDASYLAQRIGELHYHAAMHEGELCAKLNRARIGGMVEVLSRIGLEVDCAWTRPDKSVLIMDGVEFLQHKERLRQLSRNLIDAPKAWEGGAK